MKTIPLLTKTGEIVAHAMVDDDVYEAVREHTWRLNSGGYAVRGSRAGGRYRTIFLHHVVLGIDGTGIKGDHRNRNRLDDQRSNLRVATQGQNRQNVQSAPGSSSRYRGVTWDRVNSKWKAQAMLHGKMHNLGRFESEDEAGEVASRFRAEHMPFSSDAEAAA